MYQMFEIYFLTLIPHQNGSGAFVRMRNLSDTGTLHFLFEQSVSCQKCLTDRERSGKPVDHAFWIKPNQKGTTESFRQRDTLFHLRIGRVFNHNKNKQF